MRASTAAARAGSSSAGPASTVGGSAWIGAVSMTVRADSSPAMAHTMVDRRRTGMPSTSARSAFSDAARTATPSDVRVRNHASAPATTGTMITMTTWFPVNSTGSSVKLDDSGVRNEFVTSGCPNSDGRPASTPPRIWARPMVASVRMRRGAQKNRRMTTRSTSAPVAAAATAPSARHRK